MSNEQDSRVEQELRAAYEVLGSERDSGLSVYAFSSFDLVNSTSYKSRAPQRWPDVIKSFYYSVERTVERVLHDDDALQPQVWKYIGDEVVLFTRVYDDAELYRALQMTADACALLQNEVAERDADDDRVQRAHRLGVKASCWIAPVGDVRSDRARNIEVQTRTIPIRDFLGPDIDTGFRIGKSAMRGAVTISAMLAELLVQAESSRSRLMRLVGYHKLKGVWSGRPYPSIWYRCDWHGYEHQFDYDELHDMPKQQLVAQLRPAELRTALLQTNNLEINEQIREYFARAARPPVRHRSPSNLVEVHVAAACYDRARRRVLMRKRRSGKDVEKPRIWDFGSALLTAHRDVGDTLIAEYHTKYGVDLRPGIDEPLSYYSYCREGRVVSGLVFAAEVDSGPAVMRDYNQCAMQWYPLDEGPPADAVDDARKVFDGIRRLFG